MSLKEKMQTEHYSYRHGPIAARLLCKIKSKTFYIPCLEVPVTTHCTLCCEECANLIQYYKQPYHISVEKIIRNVMKLSLAVDGIDCIRILGGEPLLHPNLDILLKYLAEEKKISNVTIVTNGTLRFEREACNILANNKKFKVSVSAYPCAEKSRIGLIRQMERKHIFYAAACVTWKEKASVLYQGKSPGQLRDFFKNCPNHFFSLLNGELHVCPRSSHGTDLGIIPKFQYDFVELEEEESPGRIRQKIQDLLERPYLTACNYCEEDKAEGLKVIESGKQASRSDMQKRLSQIFAYNQSYR